MTWYSFGVLQNYSVEGSENCEVSPTMKPSLDVEAINIFHRWLQIMEANVNDWSGKSENSLWWKTFLFPI